MVPIGALHQLIDISNRPVLPAADAAHGRVLVAQVLVHHPGDVGQRAIGDVLAELGDVDDVLPAIAVADGLEGVEHRPRLGVEAIEVGAIELPGHSGGQDVGHRGGVEAGRHLGGGAGAALQDGDGVAGGLVAAPVQAGRNMRGRIAQRPARLRRQQKGVAGKAGAQHVGKEAIAQRIGPRILPVIGDIALGILRPGQSIAAEVRSGDALPAIHLAARPVGEGAPVFVAEIARRAVGSVRAAERGPVLELAGGGSVRARKRPEVVVEGVVLFDEDHHVLDGIAALGLARAGREQEQAQRGASQRARHRTCENRTGQAAARKISTAARPGPRPISRSQPRFPASALHRVGSAL